MGCTDRARIVSAGTNFATRLDSTSSRNPRTHKYMTSGLTLTKTLLTAKYA